jgi:hypothetical protein
MWEQTFVKKHLSEIQKFDKNRIKDSQKSSIKNSVKKFDKNFMKQKFVKNNLETNLAKVWQNKSFT